MKRRLSLLLALLLCLSLFACGRQPEAPPANDTPPAAETPPVETPPQEPDPDEPLPEEPVAPEKLQYKPSNVMFTFTDDKEESLLTLISSIPIYEGATRINDYYQAVYDDLFAVC